MNPEPPPACQVHTLIVGSFSVNCYVVAGENGRAFVIDPGDDAPRIADFIRSRNLQVAAYLITHGHMDHISALAELSETLPAPIGIHPRDAEWAFGSSNSMPPYYDAPGKPKNKARELADGQVWDQTGTPCRVLTTPGHSPGGVCFYFRDAGIIFTGDTLFAGSVGRTDLSGGNDAVLSQSLKRLTVLPDNTIVFPGHGPQSTIAREKKSNPFLKHIA